MALFCSCGTDLPDNARFCHNCGKPQREQDLVSSEVPLAAPPPAAAAGSLINFGNPGAVRVGLLCASLSALLNVIPFLSLGCCLWWLGGGFFSAFLYSRRTGLTLSVGDGARMGWITGLLTFVIGIVLTAFLFLASRGGGLQEALRQTIEKMPARDAATRQIIEFMNTPVGLAILLVTYIFLGFLVIVALTVAGGALGAKVMEKE